LGFGDLRLGALTDSFRRGGYREVTEVEGFDGSGLMIEDMLQAFGNDIGDLEALNLRL
jgi:hypothetical protein